MRGYIYIYTCYFSPNKEQEAFEIFLRSVDRDIRERTPEKILIVGDFNAKSPTWGAPRADLRGNSIEEWMAEKDLNVVNNGKPTFERNGSVSHIDITLCGRNLRDKITNWDVDEEENLSLHKNILFEVSRSKPRYGILRTGRGFGWHFNTPLLERAKEKLAESFNRIIPSTMTLEEFQRVLTDVCEATFPKRIKRRGRSAKYWWNDEIAEKRRVCIRLRREVTRTAKRRSQEDVDLKREEYKQGRRQLKQMILKAKEKCWKGLLDELNENVWGDAYKIAVKRVGGRQPPQIDERKRMEIAKSLFPEAANITWTKKKMYCRGSPPFWNGGTAKGCR
jgi:Endonuclease/Exonuclease/phosphatase family.